MERNSYIQLFEKYLRGKASECEKETLAALLRDDQQIHRFFEKGLQNADSTLNEETAARIYRHIRASVSSPQKRISTQPLWRKAMQWAAIFLLPVLSALAVYYFTSESVPNENFPVTITAANGEKAEVTLADGSRVWLNSGSSLTYDSRFNGGERNVFLDGEAYFEVAKDAKQSFIVRTSGMNVEALGTAFNVRSYQGEEEASAVLLEGKVKINALGQETVLIENQRATFSKSSRLLRTDIVHASDFMEWTSGNLYFDNQTFDEIARTLSRVFNVEIRFASENLRTTRFSGTLGNSSIRNALDILSLTSSMRYEMRGTTIELYYKD